MISRRPLLAGLAAQGALALGVARAQESGLLGAWSGVLDLGSQKLRLRIEIGAGGRATLYSLDQGAAPIPAKAELGAGSVAVDVPAVGGRYVAKLVNGRLEGAWSQGGGSLPLVLSRVAAAPPTAALTQELLAKIRAEAGSPALAAAAQHRGAPLQVWVDGERELRSGRQATAADLWHIGSITKSMTATLVGRLMDGGRMRWEDTLGDALADVVPDMRPEYRRVTLRHLLSHRSGLPPSLPIADLVRFPRESEDPRADRIAFARLALAQPAEGAVGERFAYSNSGYVLAGLMVERRLGTSWEAAIRTHLFEPLGLQSAGFGAPPADGHPYGHNVGSDGTTLTAYPPTGVSDNPAVAGPAGRVRLTLPDLMAYVAAHRDRTSFLRPITWTALHTPPFGGDYALGWIVRSDGSLWHNGSNTFWYAEATFHPGQGVAAAAVANDGRMGIVGPAVRRALAGAVAAARRSAAG